MLLFDKLSLHDLVNLVWDLLPPRDGEDVLAENLEALIKDFQRQGVQKSHLHLAINDQLLEILVVGQFALLRLDELERILLFAHLG